MEPRNETDCGRCRGFLSGTSTETPESPGAEVPPGSKNVARMYRGSTGTWEVLSFPLPTREGHPAKAKSPGPITTRSTRWGANERARSGTAK